MLHLPLVGIYNNIFPFLLGFAFIQHPSLMFEQEVKNLYNSILSDKNSSVNLKIQVLKNLQTYLQEEDTRMQQADRDWKKVAKQEDLKEMGDVSSGMSSSIMQLYLKQVLEAFFHTQSSVRHFALNVIALTLNQGLIHPVQVGEAQDRSAHWQAAGAAASDESITLPCVIKPPSSTTATAPLTPPFFFLLPFVKSHNIAPAVLSS